MNMTHNQTNMSDNANAMNQTICRTLAEAEVLLVITSFFMAISVVCLVSSEIYSICSAIHARRGSNLVDYGANLFLSSAYVIFLPLMSYLFSMAKQYDLQKAHVILIWMVLIESIRFNVDPIPTWGPKKSVEQLIRLFWVGFLVYSYIDRHTTVIHACLFVLCVYFAVSLLLKGIMLSKANESYLIGKNPKLIQNYIKRVMSEDDLHTTPMNKCNYIVMGEENHEITVCKKGYFLGEKKPESAGILTIGRVFELNSSEDEEFTKKHPYWRDCCLSLALAKMLRRRFVKLPLDEAGYKKALDFVLVGLIDYIGNGSYENTQTNGSNEERERNPIERIFTIICEELKLVSEFLHMKVPIYHYFFGYMLVDMIGATIVFFTGIYIIFQISQMGPTLCQTLVTQPPGQNNSRIDTQPYSALKPPQSPCYRYTRGCGGSGGSGESGGYYDQPKQLGSPYYTDSDGERRPKGTITYTSVSPETKPYAIVTSVVAMKVFSDLELAITIFLFVACLYTQCIGSTAYWSKRWISLNFVKRYIKNPANWKKSHNTPETPTPRKLISPLANLIKNKTVMAQRHNVKKVCALSSVLDIKSETIFFCIKVDWSLLMRLPKWIRREIPRTTPTAFHSVDTKEAILRSLRNSGGGLTNGETSLRNHGMEHLNWACQPNESTTEAILVWHIATTLFDHQKSSSEHNDNHHQVPSFRENTNFLKERNVALQLSNYCHYLVEYFPELLPDEVEWTTDMYEMLINDILAIDRTIGQKPTKENRCNELLNRWGESSMVEEATSTSVVEKGAKLAKDLKKCTEDRVWKMLAVFWAEMMLFVAPSDNVEGHEKILHREELITQLWALLTHAGILIRPEPTEHYE